MISYFRVAFITLRRDSFKREQGLTTRLDERRADETVRRDLRSRASRPITYPSCPFISLSSRCVKGPAILNKS